MRVLDTELAKSLQGDAPRNGLTRWHVDDFLGRDLLRLTNDKQARYHGGGPKDAQRHLTNDSPPVCYVVAYYARLHPAQESCRVG